MGLDMYLYRRPYGENVGYWRKANQVLGWIEARTGEVENCKDVRLSRELLEELLADCKKIKGLMDNSEKVKASLPDGFTFQDGKLQQNFREGDTYPDDVVSQIQDIMPTTQGFFFGSYNIDEYYYEDIENTIEIVEKVLKDTNFETEVIVFHAWW